MNYPPSHQTVVEAIQALRNVTERGFCFLREEADGSLHEAYVPYVDLEREIVGRAGAMQAAGLRQGQRLPIIIEDSRDFIISFLGAIFAGVVPVSVYPPAGVVQLRRYAQTIAAIVAKCDAAALLTTANLASDLHAIGAFQDLELLTTEALRGRTALFTPAQIRPGDVAFLQFTSGSTSSPKGVTITHRNIADNTAAIAAGMHLTTADLMVSWLPMHHDMGLVGFMLTPMFHAVSLHMLPTQVFLRRPGSWLRAISGSAQPVVSVAPNFAFARVARRMKEQDVSKLDLSRWRLAGCGAEPVIPADLEMFADKLAPAGFRREALQPMYGLAEATLAVTFSPLGAGLATCRVDAEKLRLGRAVLASEGTGTTRIANCGVPLPGWEVNIFAPEDACSERPLDAGEVGEVRMRGPSVMAGYWNDPAATQAAMAGNYLRTGDMGFLLDGQLHLCGRAKELMIFNGRNYFPDDIERAVLTVPGVRLAMAFQSSASPADPERGVGLVIAAETAVPGKVDAAAVRRAVNTEVGLSVDEIVFVAVGSLPKTTSGKLQRREACRQYEAGTLPTFDEAGNSRGHTAVEPDVADIAS